MSQPLLQRTEVRQAVQVAVGAGAAIVAGTMLSGQRWYWALIAAFIVGIGTGSRGEALVKGGQRLVGTLAGVLVGIALATLVSGHLWLSAVLALACVFLAFYAFQVAYSTMIFFITVMLALLYGMLGRFKPELLVLRLEETAIGAAAGMLATTFVLPVKQNRTFADKLAAFLEALEDAIRDAAKARGTGGRDDPVRALGQARQDLRNSVGGLKRGWLRFVDRRYLLTMRAAMRCAYLAREAIYHHRLSPESAARIAERIATLRAAVAAQEPPALPPRDAEGASDDLCVALQDAVDRLAQRYRALAEMRR